VSCEHWPLLDEEQFRYTGPDWLLLLLDGCLEETRDLVKLLPWKTWSAHNNITHQAAPTSISEAVFSLISMQSTLSEISASNSKCSVKGKFPIAGLGKTKPSTSGSKPLGKTAWEPPPSGWIKVNFDGSFVAQDGKAGAGVVARDSGGQVIFTAWRALFRCQNAEEVEAQACLEGLRLAAEWAQGPVIVKTDCARIVHAMEAKIDRSMLSFVVTPQVLITYH